MILLGLQMLHLLPSLTRFLPTMPKSFGHAIHNFAERDANGGAFALGAATFFLPCGFTQALQLYVLAKGSFMVGALTMLAPHRHRHADSICCTRHDSSPPRFRSGDDG
jgi:uncharacterized protein